jgi:hypothetical protein
LPISLLRQSTATTAAVEIGEVLDVAQSPVSLRWTLYASSSLRPKRDGRAPDGKCEGCESLYVIHLYTKIAKRRAEDANLIMVRVSSDREEQRAIDEQPSSETGDET